MRRLFCALLVLVACHKVEKPETKKPSPSDADALWALAPAGAKLGFVVTPRALRMLEHAWQDVHAFIKNAPELATVSAMLDHELASVGGELSLAAFGLTADKGAAVFFVDEHHGLIIIPVADRDRFVQKTGGTKGTTVDQIQSDFVCKPTHGVYACGDSEEVIATIGTAKSAPHLDARGDVEMFMDGFPFPGKSGSFALQLERGAVTARGTFDGVPPMLGQMFGIPVKPTLDREHTSGFLATSLAGVKTLAPPVPLLGDVTLASFLQSVVGPVMVTTPAGQPGVDVQIPLLDPAPSTALVAHCIDVLPPQLDARVKDSTCIIPLPLQKTELSAWVDGKTLRIGVKNLPKPNSVALTKLGAELASGTWNTVMWGRGSLLAGPMATIAPALGPQIPMAVRIGSVLSEIGFATRIDGTKGSFVATVRTIWSNPDEVVAKLTALPVSAMLGPDGAARAREAAGTTSPLAADLNAGFVGLALPAAVIGGLVVPVVIDRMTPPRRIETETNFDTLTTALQRVHAATGKFPVGDTGLTPPASCCKGPHYKCDAGPKAWATGPWKALSFELTAPALFQYRYHSDGKTAEVQAVGDLDCDGIEITYRLKASVNADGKPVFELERPAPNTD